MVHEEECEVFENAEKLGEWLTNVGHIKEVHMYGKGLAKSLDALLDEMKNGTTRFVLRNQEGGSSAHVERELRVCTVNLYVCGRALVETEKVRARCPCGAATPSCA